ncbi:MAG: PilZ domain-containing protein [Myxococcota bacterium]
MTAMTERRATARIDKVFRVSLSTEELGEQWYVARNISAAGMFVEMAEPLPLNARVVVRFSDALGVTPPAGGQPAAICALARIQNHYYLQFSDGEGLRAICGVGLRFLRFIPEAGATPPPDALH